MDANRKQIAFSPPDITEAEIEAVEQVLRSGWITTGPRTKELEERLCDFTGASGLACLSSATAALECALRILGVGPGDEVVVPAYTYTATAAAVAHVGASPVLVDVAEGSFFPDAQAYANALTPRTKAVVPVDIGGRMADYPAIQEALASFGGFSPASEVQEALGRVALVADAAHSLGASLGEARSGQAADFTAFSFHAVKNLTTAEGGALAWRDFGFDSSELYRRAMLLSLHGQTKDALHKESGSWEYDIEFCGYKWNMTDIQAALGLAQLERYPRLLERRKELVYRYGKNLEAAPVQLMTHSGEGFSSSAHLMLTRVDGLDEGSRNALVGKMAEAGIACNVHYKPLPLLSAYQGMGFDIAAYPRAYAQYANEVTLPLHTLLADADVDYVCEQYTRFIGDVR